MERNNDFACTGWIPPAPTPASRGQLIALRDFLLSQGCRDSAAAVDNAIDVIENEKIARAVAAYNEDGDGGLWNDYRDLKATQEDARQVGLQ